MLEKVKKLRELRKRKVYGEKICPMCNVKMKRKGKKGRNEFFKCPKCKGKLSLSGTFEPPPNPDTLDMKIHELKAFRKEMAKRKLIVRLKKEKYLGYKQFQWEGEIINLDDYDVDGVSLEEKRRMEEEKKKQEQEKEVKKNV